MADVTDLAAWLTQMWDHDVAKYERATANPYSRYLLAHIAAERQILEIHSPDPRDPDVCTTCGEPLEYCWPWPCETVKALASRYADMPGFRDEWLLPGAAGERQEQSLQASPSVPK